MWWENDAVNLLMGMGVTRTFAVSLVDKIKRDRDLTASEAGMWAKVVTMLGGAAVIATIARPRPNSAQLISTMTNSYVDILRTAIGPRECGAEIWYPLPGKGNRWDLIRCPLREGHKGLHADANHVPFFADADIEFFNYQHKLATE